MLMQSRWKRFTARILVLNLGIVSLFLLPTQGNAAALCGIPLLPKGTPTPTVDPTLLQAETAPLTVGSTVLVLIVLIGIAFTLFRRREG